MNWFYAKDGQQAGPVDDAELDRLVTTGDIADSTLVWHSGLPNWQSYAAVHAGAGVGGVALAPGVGTGAVRVGSGQTQCSQCGRVFPADEVVRIDNLDVCAGCKPGFIQRLREGAIVGSSQRFAGFGIRLGAAVLDGLILIPVFALYAGALFAYIIPHANALRSQDSGAALTFQLYNLSLGLGLQVFLSLYSAFCVARFGGTPGKRICKLRIVKGDGSKVFFGRAWGRYLSKAFISRLFFFIGYFFIFFDAQKRALHDMICDTRVIYDAE